MNVDFCRIDNYIVDMGFFILLKINNLCEIVFNAFINDHRIYLSPCIDIRKNIPPDSLYVA